tara:strand:- start:423 stop:815 length:393 start_codon:yes stop_codon:yes gene_type:complete
MKIEIQIIDALCVMEHILDRDNSNPGTVFQQAIEEYREEQGSVSVRHLVIGMAEQISLGCGDALNLSGQTLGGVCLAYDFDWIPALLEHGYHDTGSLEAMTEELFRYYTKWHYLRTIRDAKHEDKEIHND